MEIKPVALDEVWAMRHDVMYPDEAWELVKLPDDETGMHLGLYEQEELLSVVSVFEKENQIQFRKFATRSDKQGQGYGTRLLNYVMEQAERQNAKSIWCNARTNAISFYQKFGMKPEGNTWERLGHTFIRMKKKIG